MYNNVDEFLAEVSAIYGEGDIKQAKIDTLVSHLSASSSQWGDWKNLKQLDTNEYTAEEMAQYRADRAKIRQAIKDLEDE